MATPDPALLVSVLTGESTMGFVRFLSGQPVAPLTVGLDGNWRIVAPGVARVHLNLMFDGRELYVAALAPDMQVSINGAPIDGRWWMLKAPAEIRFGQACLRVFAETPSLPAPAPRVPGGENRNVGTGGPSALPTRLDAAGQWESQHREDSQPVGMRTQLYDPSKALPGIAGKGAHGQPRPAKESASPPPQIQSPFAPVPVAKNPGPNAQSSPPFAARVAPGAASLPARGALEPAAPGAPAAATNERSSLYPASSGEPPMASTLRRPLPGERGVEPGAGSGDTAPPPPMGPTIVADASVWMHPANAKPTPGPGLHPSAAPGRRDDGDQDALPAGIPGIKRRSAIVEAWRSASLVKKIIFFLLPLAFVGVLLPQPSPPPGPAANARAVSTASAPASAGSPAPTPSALAVATSPSGAPMAVASANPKDLAGAPLESPSATPAAGTTAANPRTKATSKTSAPAGSASAGTSASARAPSDPVERAAIDAAFEGRWQDAVTLYDRLAASRPDEPVFQEAARILREEKLRTK